MLTTEHTSGTRQRPADLQAEEQRGTRAEARLRSPLVLRVLAAGLGLLAALLSAAVPLLPVVQQTATITWPNGGDVEPVVAPLASYEPEALRATVPCAAMQSADARTPGSVIVLSTTPPRSATEAGGGMNLRVADGELMVIARARELVSAELAPPGCDVTVNSTMSRTTVTMGDRVLVDERADVRPQVVGIYSELQEGLDPIDGLAVQVEPDTRYQGTAHPLKIAAMLAAVAALAGCLVALHALDVRTGRRAPRLVPRGWWRPTSRDLTVGGVLAVWVVIGAVTSDDGYILTVAQVREQAGYISNYYRWFNVPEAPFGWFYELYAVWSQFSTSPPWMRLPSFFMGVISWLLVSREVLPRLGREVRRSRAAGWAAAAVFLIWWMPYNNGLRPEPVVAIGSLLALAAVERAVATRRLLPLVLGVLAAAFTVAATPTGLIAVAPFLVAGRPMWRLLRDRSRLGWLPVLGPIVGAGLLVLVVIFADQTLAAVLEATQIRTRIGPSYSWFEEPLRYLALFSYSADGAIARRFPVLLVLLCVATCVVVLLRRGGIPGAAGGPSRRLIGTTALSLALIALTPTKWTHHFGAFAALGAAMAALTALATSSTVLRSKRNRMLFLSALLGISALAATGPNAPWYVSEFGVPWYDKPPSFQGYRASTVLLLLAAIPAFIALVEHVRAGPPGAPPPLQERRRRSLWLASTPLVIVCGFLVLAQVAAMAKGMHKQRDSYSLGTANVEQLAGPGCGLSDYVLVEGNPVASVLTPLPAGQQATIGGPGASEEGFFRERQGSPPGVVPEPNPGADPAGPPPHFFGGDVVPVWSSYTRSRDHLGELRTPWYGLPQEARDGEAPLVVTVAGGVDSESTPVFAEFGRQGPGGARVVSAMLVEGPATEEVPDWREYRLNLAGTPAADADTVRLIAVDNNITPDGWISVAAPRVPQLQQMTEFVGRQTPVFFDWPVGFVFPCLRPAGVSNGIAQVPEFRILSTSPQRDAGYYWSDRHGGGPFGWLAVIATQRELPTYLAGDWNRDWGELNIVVPAVPAGEPTVVEGKEVRWGLHSPDASPVEQGGGGPGGAPAERGGGSGGDTGGDGGGSPGERGGGSSGGDGAPGDS